MAGVRRVVLAVLAGGATTAAVGALWLENVVAIIQEPIAWLLPESAPHAAFDLSVGSLTLAVVALPGMLVALMVYSRLRGPAIGETRCRACGHLLRGLTEPRCPECGERI